MSTRATHAAILLSTAAACLMATGVQAQTATGPRYMSWAGRPASTTPANVVAAQVQVEAQAEARRGMIPRRIAPSQAVSRPMMQPTPAVQTASRGLTPASAWLSPSPVSSFAPGSPDPLAYTREMMGPVPAPIAAPVAAPVAAPIMAADTTNAPNWQAAPRQPQPDFLPSQGVPSSVVAEAAQPSSVAPADPMAPRSDALIFRLRPQAAVQASAPVPTGQTDQPAAQVYAEATTPTAAQPGQQSSRYYSVHRDAGHAPDRTRLPEAVYYDSVALDLAEPPETQTPQRDAQGRLRPPTRSDDPERP